MHALGAKEFLEEQLESERSRNGDDDDELLGMGSGVSLGSELGSMGGGKPQMNLREKCARLEREVRQLKEGGGGDSGETTMLQSQVEDLQKIRTKVRRSALCE